MPSKSKKQARTMRAAAHDKSFANKMGITQPVAREFVKKDKTVSSGKVRHPKAPASGKARPKG